MSRPGLKAGVPGGNVWYPQTVKCWSYPQVPGKNIRIFSKCRLYPQVSQCVISPGPWLTVISPGPRPAGLACPQTISRGSA